MRKKEIERIPYLGLKKISRKEDVKYIGMTAVKIVGNKKHLFLEVYKNEKESKRVPVVRIVLTEKEFWNYFPEQEKWTRQKIVADGGYGNFIWGKKKRAGSRGEKISSKAQRIWKESKSSEELKDINTTKEAGGSISVNLRMILQPLQELKVHIESTCAGRMR